MKFGEENRVYLMKINFMGWKRKITETIYFIKQETQVYLKTFSPVWCEYQADWIDEAAFKLTVLLSLFYILSAFNSGNRKLESDHFHTHPPCTEDIFPQWKNSSTAI